MSATATRKGTSAEVVDDGQREQEGAQRDREPAAHDRQHGEGEGDVGRHRDPPADEGVALVEGQDDRDVEQRRQRHAPERRDDGDDGLGAVRQRSQDELVLELEARHEEEHRQQAVGGPDGEAQVEVQRRRADGDLGELGVGLPPGRVGPDEGDHGGDQQQRAADRLAPQRLQDVRPLREGQPVEHDPGLGHVTSVGRPARAGAQAPVPTRLPGSPAPTLPQQDAWGGPASPHPPPAPR
jgi:hypothetical protein